MHNHIVIVTGGEKNSLTLKPDTSLTITDQNPMFNDVEMFSLPLPVPFEQNRHLLKNFDDRDSALRALDFEKTSARIIVDGIPLRTAVMRVQEDVEVGTELSVNFDSAHRTFKDMIADLRCRDVNIADDILIGEKIGDVEVNISYQEVLDVLIWSGWKSEEFRGFQIKMNPVSISEVFQPLALGFSYPGQCNQDAATLQAYPKIRDGREVTKSIANQQIIVPDVALSFINTSQPYPAAKYCNSRICYAHHAVEESSDGEKTTSSDIVPAKQAKYDGSDYSPYWVLDADRPASGICFYVAYFLECLFKHIGVAYDMRALTDIEDFNYLCFFSTGCHFNTKEISSYPILQTEESINKWLESRGCGGKMNLFDNKPNEENLFEKGIRNIDLTKDEYQSWSKTGDHGAPGTGAYIESADGSIHIYFGDGAGSNTVPGTQGYEVYKNVYRNYEVTHSMTAKVLNMYANSDNFPNVSVSEVIESLENSFGVRFCYDAETNKVTVRLLRDIFRDNSTPIKFKGQVLSMRKITEKITGVKMKYAAESDTRDQRDNVRYNKRDYDTTYNYIDYPQGRTVIGEFIDIAKKIDVGNRNGYVDLTTGDFFRVKVSSDASTTEELKPAIFEVGQYKGVEMGDCSEENNDYVRELVSQFEPIIINDVAYGSKDLADINYKPKLVPYIDEDMEHEFLTKKTAQSCLYQVGHYRHCV